MIGERTENALSRIHAALDRIETAGSQALGVARTLREAGVEQARKHETLRTAVAETLRDLDLLIGAGEHE
jgi:hypothetical protein